MEKKQNVPALRFRGFSSEWNDFTLEKCTNRFDNLRVPISASQRIAGSTPYYGANGIQDYVHGYTHKGEYILIAEDGANDVNNYPIHYVNGEVWVNNHAHVLQGKDGIANTKFLKYALSKMDFRSHLVGGSRAKLNANIMMAMEVKLPLNASEQKLLGEFLDDVDGEILLRQHKIQKLQQFRQAMLTKLFPREGAAEPELRFRGFSDKWRMEKFSKLVFIERGGSPRPIDSYITNAEDGLNWVKIGDAPKYGIYITHTAEKIKPAGLSMTRQVYPGDLILSNSMSFGRPYIMTITGCIHDGWLLIRNSNKIFDLKFLYCLLGSPNVLKQYKALAAGSAVNNLNKALVGSVIIQYPSMEEQKQIGKFFDQLDSFISLQQKKLERMQRLKGALLEKMFV